MGLPHIDVTDPDTSPGQIAWGLSHPKWDRVLGTGTQKLADLDREPMLEMFRRALKKATAGADPEAPGAKPPEPAPKKAPKKRGR